MSRLDDIRFDIPAISPVHGDPYVRHERLTVQVKQEIKELFKELIRESIQAVHKDEKAIYILLDKVEKL